MVDLPAGRFYNFFIDDNIFFFQDLVRGGCRSLFDCFYLRELRRLHREFGLSLTLNTFFANWHDAGGFNLTAVPDRYRSEFADNADWLRLAFHADLEFPDVPYSLGCPEQLAEHYGRWRRELVRIAGESALLPPMVIHCFDLTPENRRFLRERGMRFIAKRRGTLDYRPDYDQFEVPVSGFLNLFNDDPGAVRRYYMELTAAGPEKILAGTHEQYAFPFYAKYQPGYFQQLRTFCAVMAERGYRPVFFYDLLKNYADSGRIDKK